MQNVWKGILLHILTFSFVLGLRFWRQTLQMRMCFVWIVFLIRLALYYHGISGCGEACISRFCQVIYQDCWYIKFRGFLQKFEVVQKVAERNCGFSSIILCTVEGLFWIWGSSVLIKIL